MKSVLIIIILFIATQSQAQQSLFTAFMHLRFPEKCWVIGHLPQAKKSFTISLQVKKTVDSLANLHFLDGDAGGGQLDAYRHSYWMALLSSFLLAEDAKSLGIAHEKSNYIDFKKRKQEDNSLPDKTDSEMDLWNNDVGLRIGLQHPYVSIDSLQKIIVNALLSGEMKIIRKNKNGKAIDINNQIIPTDSLQHRWITPRLLVPSNFVRPE